MDDTLFLLLALVFLAAMLFYSSRKRKKAAEQLRSKIVKGAYVMLTSGIFGKITNILDNQIELEVSSGSKMLVATGAVSSIEVEPKSSKSAPKSESKPASDGKAASKSTTKTKSVAKPASKTAPKSK